MGWARSAAEFADAKSLAMVGGKYQAVAVNEDVTHLDHRLPARFRIRHPERWRNERSDLDRSIFVSDIEHPEPGMLVGREDEFRADKGARPVLMDVVRSEMTAFRLVVGVFGRGKGRDADRVRPFPDIKQPDRLIA